MAGMDSLRVIKTISKSDRNNFVELTKLFNDILQISSPSPSKIASGLERPEIIPRESREGEENTSDFDDNDSYPSEISAYRSRNSDKETHRRHSK